MWQSSAPENPPPAGQQVELALPHIRLCGRRWGAKDKPLLLALHGWLDNANSFAPLAGHLSDFQLLAIDWPGHGLSDHRPGAYPLHWLDYLYDLDQLLAHLGQTLAPVAILGHSLGGIVASAYTAGFGAKVNKLVLIEALCPLFEDAAKSGQRLAHSFNQHGRWLGNRGKPATSYESLEVAVRARAGITGLDESWCRLLVERNMRQTEQGFCWRSDPRLKLDSPLRLTFEQVDALMQQVATPTLLLTGSEGFHQLRSALPLARGWYRHLTEAVLPGDHHLHMGNAAGVAAEIRAFLAEKSVSAGR
ncbi:alpha/beta fold hydrolase [Shewanella salipaludis]|uniref:Alpha/beta hydrolase n=1 Tax=Shewanella salipaludis TaxID=2723052 RepID=A0A972FQZ5_9GAMM|nr:alpha/beta hydrolase [Shewanella salipaludis]NMH64151.1 alpha/beta hydrolase [Shewanella salipaludis]